MRITLHEIKHLELPALTDDFAREVGDFETLEDLKQAIRDDLALDARREADAGVRRRLIEEIAAANNVQAPRSLVDRLLRAYAQAYEVPESQLGQFVTEFRPIAEAQVRRDLILDQVARSRGLAATEEEVDQRIAELATRRKQEPGELYASLQKAGRLKEIEQSITEEKVFTHLLEQSTINDS